MNNNLKLLIESFLNEARMHETLDRKLLLAVSSVCSRNRSTNAEFIKPLSKWDKDMLLNRYVAALIVMKKPCPLSPEDIEKIGTFKLVGQKALLLGATIDDINDLYDKNTTSNWRQKHNINFERKKAIETPAATIPQQKRSDPLDLAEEFIKDIPVEMYPIVNQHKDYYLDKDEFEPYMLAKPYMEAYINKQIKLANYDFNKFSSLIKKDFRPMYKALSLRNKVYLRFYDLIDHLYSITIGVVAEISDEQNAFSGIHMFSYYPSLGQPQEKDLFLFDLKKNDILRNLKENKIIYKYFDKPQTGTAENLDVDMCEHIYVNLIMPYVNWKIEKEKFAPTYKNSLKKYNIIESEEGNFAWFKNNIKNILKNNPDKKIVVRFIDWLGQIDRIYYDSKKKKYCVDLSPLNDSTDTWAFADLDEILRCTTQSGYRYHSRDDLYVIVHDLNSLGKKVYDIVLELIKYGKLI